MFRGWILAVLLLAGHSARAAPEDDCAPFFADFSERRENGTLRIETYSLEQRVPLGLACAHSLGSALAAARSRTVLPEIGAGDRPDDPRPTIESLEALLSRVEENLKTIAKQLDSKIKGRCGCGDELVLAERRLAQIRQYFNIHTRERIYTDHSDYDRYFFSLRIGYEYNSISEILADSSPRVGLLINQYYGRRPYKAETGFGYRGLQLSADMTLSGEKEQKTSDAAPVDEDNQKLGIDLLLFSPLHIVKVRKDLSLQTGPLAMAGFSQTDADSKIRDRNYVGLRSAFSPEHFIDVLVGRSPGLDSTRMEVRGQMPIARLAGGSLLYIGIAANMGVADRRDDEEDVITTYFSWSIDFTDLLATGG